MRLNESSKLFLSVRERRDDMNCRAIADLLSRLIQLAWCVPQSNDQMHFRKASTKTRTQIASAHHNGRRRGGDADQVGFALFNEFH